MRVVVVAARVGPGRALGANAAPGAPRLPEVLRGGPRAAVRPGAVRVAAVVRPDPRGARRRVVRVAAVGQRDHGGPARGVVRVAQVVRPDRVVARRRVARVVAVARVVRVIRRRPAGVGPGVRPAGAVAPGERVGGPRGAVRRMRETRPDRVGASRAAAHGGRAVLSRRVAVSFADRVALAARVARRRHGAGPVRAGIPVAPVRWGTLRDGREVPVSRLPTSDRDVRPTRRTGVRRGLSTRVPPAPPRGGTGGAVQPGLDRRTAGTSARHGAPATPGGALPAQAQEAVAPELWTVSGRRPPRGFDPHRPVRRFPRRSPAGNWTARSVRSW